METLIKKTMRTVALEIAQIECTIEEQRITNPAHHLYLAAKIRLIGKLEGLKELLNITKNGNN